MALAFVSNEFYDLRNKFQTMLQVNTIYAYTALLISFY